MPTIFYVVLLYFIIHYFFIFFFGVAYFAQSAIWSVCYFPYTEIHGQKYEQKYITEKCVIFPVFILWASDVKSAVKGMFLNFYNFFTYVKIV